MENCVVCGAQTYGKWCTSDCRELMRVLTQVTFWGERKLIQARAWSLSDSLLLREIKQWQIVDAGKTIVFDTDKGLVLWSVEAECCSATHLENAVDIPLGTVSLIEHRHLNTEEKGDDVIRFHSVHIRTDKGYGDINFRNESNGYYDGNLVVWAVEQ